MFTNNYQQKISVVTPYLPGGRSLNFLKISKPFKVISKPYSKANSFKMTISYIFVLQTVIDTTTARPSKRGMDSFKKAVFDVLFEEKSAYYEGRGYYLDEKLFKSNKDVIAIVNGFSARLKPKWETWGGNIKSIKKHGYH